MRAFLFWILLPLVGFAAPVKVEGRLLTHEGKSPPAGVVRVKPLALTGISIASTWANPPYEPHLVDKTGRFSFTLEAPGFYALWFDVPQHEGMMVPLWLDDARPDRKHTVNVQLAEAEPPPIGSMVEIRFRDGERWLTKRMTQVPDGSWSFSAPSSAKSVPYMLQLTVPEDVNYIFNPSEPRYSTEKASLASLAEVKDGKFNVRFDPKALPKGTPEGHATVKLGDPLDAQLFAMIDPFRAGWVRLGKKYRQLSREEFAAAQAKLVQEELPSLIATADDPRAPAKVRGVAAVVLFHLRNGLGAKKEFELTKLAPANSLAWAAWPIAYGTSTHCTVSSKEVTARILREMSERNPDRVIRGNALAALAQIELTAGHEEAAAAMFRRVSSDYSDDKATCCRVPRVTTSRIHHVTMRAARASSTPQAPAESRRAQCATWRDSESWKVRGC